MIINTIQTEILNEFVNQAKLIWDLDSSQVMKLYEEVPKMIKSPLERNVSVLLGDL